MIRNKIMVEKCDLALLLGWQFFGNRNTIEQLKAKKKVLFITWAKNKVVLKFALKIKT